MSGNRRAYIVTRRWSDREGSSYRSDRSAQTIVLATSPALALTFCEYELDAADDERDVKIEIALDARRVVLAA